MTTNSTSLKSWLDTIAVPTLLRLAPHGLFIGCGGTSEYLAFAIRNRPPTETALFEINRQQNYFNSALNEKEFRPDEIVQLLTEIDTRLDSEGYVRVSIYDDSEELTIEEHSTAEIIKSIANCIGRHPDPVLFDHSFILLKSDGYWRFESYIDQYAPRRVPWENYRIDLEDLFKDPLHKWEDIFGVKCTQRCNMSEVRLVINN